MWDVKCDQLVPANGSQTLSEFDNHEDLWINLISDDAPEMASALSAVARTVWRRVDNFLTGGQTYRLSETLDERVPPKTGSCSLLAAWDRAWE